MSTEIPFSASPHDRETANFFDRAVKEFGTGRTSHVLDFGCGVGALVRGLELLGCESYGCDLERSIGEAAGTRIKKIDLSSGYTLPFQDDSFDAVFSTSVLEHAQNKDQCFAEIHRVLRRGGFSLHLFPARMYLPVELHIKVPLANWCWPARPYGWYAFWAMLGIRNAAQQGMSWKEVAEANIEYSATGLSYWSTAAIERTAMEVIGNCFWPMDFYLENAAGRYAKLTGRLPFRSFWKLVSREFRYSLLLTRKTS